MTTVAPNADVYTDFKGLADLRLGAKRESPEALRQVAQQFESVFTQMLLKGMRQASMGDPLFDSQEGGFYRDMFDSQLSLSMSKGKGLGLADMLVQQLSGLHNNAQQPVVTENRDIAPPAALRPAVPVAVPPPQAAAPTPNAGLQATPQEFVAALWPHAQRAAAELGVDPRAIVAQAALETGWGQGVSRHADGRSSHNLFGIKADARWHGDRVSTRTLEYSDGVAERKTAAFRSYDSYESSIRDYVSFVRDNPRYHQALAQGGNAHGYVRALAQAGYATDPGYAAKLTKILNGDTLGSALASIKT